MTVNEAVDWVTESAARSRTPNIQVGTHIVLTALRSARWYRSAGETNIDDLDRELVRQLSAAAKKADSSLLEMAALRLRDRINLAKG